MVSFIILHISYSQRREERKNSSQANVPLHAGGCRSIVDIAPCIAAFPLSRRGKGRYPFMPSWARRTRRWACPGRERCRRPRRSCPRWLCCVSMLALSLSPGKRRETYPGPSRSQAWGRRCSWRAAEWPRSASVGELWRGRQCYVHRRRCRGQCCPPQRGRSGWIRLPGEACL